MVHSIKTLLAAAVVSFSLTASGLAGTFEDAKAAAERGDVATALDLYRKAAEQGNPEAQISLYAYYLAGSWGAQVAIDLPEAIRWLRKAAEQGYPPAQTSLGQAYRSGEGMPQDYVIAHMWFNLAAANGEKIAAQEREALEKRMPTGQIYEAQRLAREWKPKK